MVLESIKQQQQNMNEGKSGYDITKELLSQEEGS